MDGMHYVNWNDWCNEELQKISIIDYLIVNKTGISIHEMKEPAMEMTNHEILQAVDGMYHHNLNMFQSRRGNQLPFTFINYGTCLYQKVE